jgi:hypothetical protein
MISEQLFDEADKKVKSLKHEIEKMRFWLHIFIGISILFGLMLIYFFLLL